jgi:hypothetical protein
MTQEEIAINEVKLRELASMVERQEHGRQTLLAEVLLPFTISCFNHIH